MLSLVVTASLASTAGGCRNEARPPAWLVDGTPARIASEWFEGVAVPVIVATRTTRTRMSVHPCAQPARARAVVQRVGVSGSSVTVAFGDRTLHACDSTGSGVCGHAFARVRSRQPLDPRLSLTCRDREGDALGFAWIVAGSETAYVVVRHDDYAEAYDAAGDEPIRVTTFDVDVERSLARVDVTEHAPDGRLLRTRTVRAQVSG